MKNQIVKMMGIVAVSAVVFTSCAKAPDMEVTNAKTAVEAAKTAEADRYTPTEFNALQDSMSVAMNEIETQNSKFALFRNYKKANATLTFITANAPMVQEAAVAKRAEAKAQSEQALTDATNLVAEVKMLIEKAPKGKEGKEVLAAITSDLTLVELSLNEVSTLINNNDFLTAIDKVKAATEKATMLKTELEEAIAKKGKR